MSWNWGNLNQSNNNSSRKPFNNNLTWDGSYDNNDSRKPFKWDLGKNHSTAVPVPFW